jgi:L-lactate dehydrogenase complex protein LldF
MVGFLEKTKTACGDGALARKLAHATGRQLEARQAICGELGDVEKFKHMAADLRDGVLARLDEHLDRFTEKAEQAGVRVHWAEDAAQARAIIAAVAEEHDVKRIVKSKSMVTEEIELNAALQAGGFEVVETDLGEFIIQLAGQKPSHIVLPAVHMSVEEVHGIFKEKIGYEGPADPESLTRAARAHLRNRFQQADMGISGVNFAVADQGLLSVCTNEGNGRYVVGFPRIYTAVMGIERIVKDLDSAAVILKVLARFATGQRITQYVNFTRAPGGGDGPEAVHLVLLDNGRSGILGTRYRQMLRCIRCGACLNVCPVFRYIGGQSFPGTYSGPMGAVLLPLQKGLDEAGQPSKACSLCRMCTEVCPVRIPLSELLLELRYDLVSTGRTGRLERLLMTAGAWVLRHPRVYRASQKLFRFAMKPRSHENWVNNLPSLAGKWTEAKDFPLPAKKSYLEERSDEG